MQELAKTEKRVDQFKKYVEKQPVPSINIAAMLPNRSQLFGLFDTISFGLAGALAGGFVGFFKQIIDSAQEARNVLNASQKTGLSTETVGGLNYLARLRGIDPTVFTEGMRHYQQVVGEALRGNETAIGTFRRLGISMEEIRGHTPDEIFLRTTDAVSKMADPFQRAAAMHDLLGRRGDAMARILGQNPAAIRSAIEEAKNLGLALNSVQTRQAASGMQAYREAVVRVQSVFQGVANVIMTQLGPIIEAASKTVSGWVQSWVLNQEAVRTFVRSALVSIGQFFDALIEGVAWAVGEGIPALVEALSEIPNIFRAIWASGSAVLEVVSALGRAQLPSGYEEMKKQMSGPTNSGASFRQRSQELAAQLRQAGVAENAIRGILAQMDKAKPRPARGAEIDLDPLREQQEKLQDSIKYWGMSADQILQNKMLMQATTDEQRKIVEGIIRQNQELQHTHDLLEMEKKLVEDGDSLTKQMQSPWEKLTTDLDHYSDLFHQHIIDQDTYGRAVQKAYASAAQTYGNTQFGDLIAKGSKEEILTLQRAQYGSQGESMEARIQRINENMLQEDRQQTQLQQQLLQAIQNQPRPNWGVI